MRHYKTLMTTIRGPMLVEHTDPIVEMIGHNVGKLQTMHAFKMAGIVHPPRNPGEKRKNSNIRSYNNTLGIIAGSLDGLERKYTGKEFRQEVHEWAKILYKDGRRNLSRVHHFSDVDKGEAYAYIHASEAIINAFKELKHV